MVIACRGLELQIDVPSMLHNQFVPRNSPKESNEPSCKTDAIVAALLPSLLQEAPPSADRSARAAGEARSASAPALPAGGAALATKTRRRCGIPGCRRDREP